MSDGFIKGTANGSDNCECHRCIRDNHLVVYCGALGMQPLSAVQMILCGECGNKRCPKASDHRLKCTHSNEPNQEGSVYE